MGSPLSISTAGTQEIADDPLLYLPSSTVVHLGRGEVIYEAERPCTQLYVVIAGTVQISRVNVQGRQIIIDIYRTDDSFGESALVGLERHGQEAVALEDTMLMSWARDEVEQVMDQRPTLGLALLSLMAQREVHLAERMESLLVDSIPARLAKALTHFSERLGTPGQDGSVTMRGFTHEFLSQYIGTSREQVTVTMGDLRRQQLINYSRRKTIIQSDALRGNAR